MKPQIPRRKFRRTNYSRLMQRVAEYARARGPLPELPLPTTPNPEQIALARIVGFRQFPGLLAKLILRDALTGVRRERSLRRYTIFDQLPKPVRTLINENDECEHTFMRNVDQPPSVISARVRACVRAGRANVNLADL